MTVNQTKGKMQSVKVKKSELIEVLTKNRDGHRAEFLEAQDLYRAAVIKELDAMLAEARDKKNIRRHISLPEPEDHTNDYNRELTMVSMSVEDVIELTVHEFDTFVMDNWNWKQNVIATNSFYKSAH